MTTEADLMERVKLFNLMQLPGQIQMMHMGTSYLVNDLARAVRTAEADRDAWRIRAEQAESRVAVLEAMVAELDGALAKARDALLTADSWLERWAQHVGNCRGGDRCECGLTLVRWEVSHAQLEAKGGER